MHSTEFEKVLKAIDPHFTIVENPNRPGLSNIFYDGKNFDLPVVSTELIKDEIDRAYTYTFPNGMQARFWSKEEILARIEEFLKKFKQGQMNGYHDGDEK